MVVALELRKALFHERLSLIGPQHLLGRHVVDVGDQGKHAISVSKRNVPSGVGVPRRNAATRRTVRRATGHNLTNKPRPLKRTRIAKHRTAVVASCIERSSVSLRLSTNLNMHGERSFLLDHFGSNSLLVASIDIAELPCFLGTDWITPDL
jgi:hypothetical protein